MSNPIPEDVMKAARACAVPDCQLGHHAKGYCKTHYLRWLRYGDVSTKHRPANGEARQFYKDIVLAYDGDECLIWPYARNREGYAQFDSALTSRMVCEAQHGKAPTVAHEAAHLCGKGSSGCVNRRHLVWKTRLENERDKEGHGTKAVGRRNGRSRLNDDDIHMIRRMRGSMTKQAIGAQFGISQSHVSDIHNGRKWAHLK